MPTLIGITRLGWGKWRRFYSLTFDRRKTRENLSRRIGSCNRCGACCKLLFKCPAYDETDGDPKCLVYNSRPGVCGLFPINEKDLRDRDIVMPNTKCGFDFIPKNESYEIEVKLLNGFSKSTSNNSLITPLHILKSTVFPNGFLSRNGHKNNGKQ